MIQKQVHGFLYGCSESTHQFIIWTKTKKKKVETELCFRILSNSTPAFTIRSITLTIEPDTDVDRDTDVTVRCKAIVSSSGEQALSRSYTIYKDTYEVYTKNTSSSEDLLYRLPQARVSNTGKYKCKVGIEGRQMVSDSKRLTVTGWLVSLDVIKPCRERDCEMLLVRGFIPREDTEHV